MAKNNISEWSTTPASNLDLGGISNAEGWLPSTVNNWTRELIGQGAKFYDDFGGVNTVGGTANAVTITTTTIYAALATGMALWFKPTNTNTAATTLNLDAIGAKAVRKISGATDVALGAGDLQAGSWTRLVYDATANAAAGGWIIQSGVMSFPDGTLAQPGIYFSADPDNGLRRTGTNTWTAVAGGADIAAFSTSGMTVTGTMAATSNVSSGTFSATGATAGSRLSLGLLQVSQTGTANTNMVSLYNANGLVGVLSPVGNDLTLTGVPGNIILNAASGDVRSNTTAGTNSASLVTVGGTQTLTAKTLTAPALTNYISFPATQVPSAGANDFDDYEELDDAALTQASGISASSGTITAATGVRSYTKKGREVTVTYEWTITNKGTGTQFMALTLPFTSAANGGRWVGCGSTASTGVALIGVVNEAATSVQVLLATGLTAIANDTFIFTVTYWV